MPISDYLTDDQLSTLSTTAISNLELGSVLLMYLKGDTFDKYKFSVVVGINNNVLSLATVLISSNINLKVHATKGTIAYHTLLLKENYDFLEYDSYVNCSQLFIHDYDDVINLKEGKSPTTLGKLKDDDLNSIIELIKQAPTIKKKDKDTFGFN